jgi:hypothetical protein
MLSTIAASIVTATLTLGGLSAVPASAGTAVNWHQRTCSAFHAWDRHRTTAGLDRLVIASTHLGRSYLRAGVGRLYADASSPSPKAAGHLGDDATWVNQDCGG